MSPAASADAKFNFRTVAASFIAGAGAMMLVGFVAPTLVKGGLSMASANASTYETSAPVIEPLDVAAIRAQLAEADRSMATARASTDGAMSRLERLSGR